MTSKKTRPARPLIAVVLLCAMPLLPGCLSPSRPAEHEIKPLEHTYIRIGQHLYSGFIGQRALAYTGTIDFPVCTDYPNEMELTTQVGHELYQVVGPPNQPTLRLIKKYDSGPKWTIPNTTWMGNLLSHHVYWNETLEGQSTRYTIHIWNQILNPDPIHRQDRWFNMTFIPYHTGTTYIEGEPSPTGGCRNKFDDPPEANSWW